LLRQSYSVAALVGDLATENDAMRLARSQAPVKQITTGTLCHLEAAMVQNALEGWDLNHLDFLFIENVGNWSVLLPMIWVRICAWCSSP
jgi:hydrogenase nickel incorporation protein HypB